MTIKEYVKFRKEEIHEYVSTLTTKPRLAIIQVNEDAGSNAYVKGKLKDCEELLINALLNKLPLDISEEELLKIIDEYNKDDSIDGFIVQMPLQNILTKRQ